MLQREAVGEIVHFGKIIDPATAVQLGNKVLAAFDEHEGLSRADNLRSGSITYPGADYDKYRLDAGSRCIDFMTDHDNETVDEALEVFRGKLSHRVPIKDLTFIANFYVGTGVNGEWHRDGSQEYRLLINLGISPLTLRYATSWEGHYTGYGPIREDAETITHTYKSGEGIGIDNLGHISTHPPHIGIPAPDKVFMRAYAVPKV